jgi:hypothetical protein
MKQYFLKDKRTGERRAATKEEEAEINKILEKHSVAKLRRNNGED